ncbi:alanine--glyoxylate aminotransferase family protein [Synergistaceae bacterium OttesenSCG-928-I11]|nr:alanine--glyoxylate aminotransferase family protein [Synergistaceae bacterium OttesenSCG-928-I11]
MNRYLLTPGPVPVDVDASLAMARPMISHRGADFHALFGAIEKKLERLLRSTGPVVLLPSSGTGALECLAANFARPGTKVLSVSCGVFGDRFREIVARTGAEMTNVDVEQGSGVAPAIVADAVKKFPCDVLLLTQNETSTGVLNPIAEIVAALPDKNEKKGENRPFVLVDGVSAVGAMPCHPQEWSVDGLATASQKGLLTPPGLGLVWLSARGWEHVETHGASSYYFDLALQKKYMKPDAHENPYTPPVSLYYALDAALDAILAEPEWFDLRQRAARSIASGLEALGFELLVRDAAYRSPGVTAFSLPGGGIGGVAKNLRAMGIEPAGGQGALKGKILRLAHYHDVRWPEIATILGSLFAAMGERRNESGDFMKAAFDIWEGK